MWSLLGISVSSSANDELAELAVLMGEEDPLFFTGGTHRSDMGRKLTALEKKALVCLKRRDVHQKHIDQIDLQKAPLEHDRSLLQTNPEAYCRLLRHRALRAVKMSNCSD